MRRTSTLLGNNFNMYNTKVQTRNSFLKDLRNKKASPPKKINYDPYMNITTLKLNNNNTDITNDSREKDLSA